MFRKALTIECWLKFDLPTERETTAAETMMNETEFEIFYHEHSRPLWNYARRIADSAEIADDIVQESFMRMLGVTFKPDANRRAYLYRIATNLVYDYFRSHSREMKHQPAILAEPAYEPFAAGSEITKVFDRLKPQERALLWLAYVEGHSHTEIAEMLGLQSLSVRVLLFRARRKLAGLLDAKSTEIKEYE